MGLLSLLSLEAALCRSSSALKELHVPIHPLLLRCPPRKPSRGFLLQVYSQQAFPRSSWVSPCCSVIEVSQHRLGKALGPNPTLPLPMGVEVFVSHGHREAGNGQNLGSWTLPLGATTSLEEGITQEFEVCWSCFVPLMAEFV